MAQRALGTLGSLVMAKRGEQTLRETAQQIGIGAATLLRVERGRIPDVVTFGKLCRWLGIAPGEFLGDASGITSGAIQEASSVEITVHVPAGRMPTSATVHALAQMVCYAMRLEE